MNKKEPNILSNMLKPKKVPVSNYNVKKHQQRNKKLTKPRVETPVHKHRAEPEVNREHSEE